jgi:hypothetical protein
MKWKTAPLLVFWGKGEAFFVRCFFGGVVGWFYSLFFIDFFVLGIFIFALCSLPFRFY